MNCAMKCFSLFIFLVQSTLLFSQDYVVIKEIENVRLSRENVVVATLQIKEDKAIVGDFTFENGNIFLNDSVVATYSGRRLIVNDTLYKFRIPRFSRYNKVKNESTDLQIAKVFQRNQENIVVSSDELPKNQTNDILSSWILFEQLKDIRGLEFDWFYYFTLGLILG